MALWIGLASFNYAFTPGTCAGMESNAGAPTHGTVARAGCDLVGSVKSILASIVSSFPIMAMVSGGMRAAIQMAATLRQRVRVACRSLTIARRPQVFDQNRRIEFGRRSTLFTTVTLESRFPEQRRESMVILGLSWLRTEVAKLPTCRIID